MMMMYEERTFIDTFTAIVVLDRQTEDDDNCIEIKHWTRPADTRADNETGGRTRDNNNSEEGTE